MSVDHAFNLLGLGTLNSFILERSLFIDSANIAELATMQSLTSRLPEPAH